MSETPRTETCSVCGEELTISGVPPNYVYPLDQSDGPDHKLTMVPNPSGRFACDYDCLKTYEERKDRVEEELRERLEGPTTIDAEDLKPPVCTWCGEELTGDMEIVIWDIPELDNESLVYRYRYCSEECKTADRKAVEAGEDAHRYGEPEYLDEEERELLTDGGDDEWWNCPACGEDTGVEGRTRYCLECDWSVTIPSKSELEERGYDV